MTVIIILFTIEVRDSSNFISNIILQYATFIVKKICRIHLENKLRNNL